MTNNTTTHCLTTYIASKLIVKGRVKVFIYLLFGCSILFLSYQFINYSTLTSYQSLESRQRSTSFLRHRGGHPHQKTLKDIAQKLEEKHQHFLLAQGPGQQSSSVPPPVQKEKGDSGSGGPVLQKPNRGGGGKPIFADKVLGVSPGTQKYYLRHTQSNKSFFTCLTSGKQITWDKVNDDFCDCPSDGSDEPSTAACMNGRFFCAVIKPGFPEFVPSSFVNDGICDCVDGSDEHLRIHSISCKNRA